MRTLAVPTIILALVTVAALDARVKVQVDYNKEFNFKSVKTWDWNPEGRGNVKMARTQTDDPESAQRRAEPIIMDAVAKEMTARGLSQSTGLQPDIVVTYYLLLTTNMSTQEAGQFLPSVAHWGLPPFPMSTTSIKVLNRGSLVLDLSSKGTVVWRGVAQAEIQPDAQEKQRESKIREGVRDLLKRFPPKN
jgi:hypothetical protein